MWQKRDATIDAGILASNAAKTPKQPVSNASATVERTLNEFGLAKIANNRTKRKVKENAERTMPGNTATYALVKKRLAFDSLGQGKVLIFDSSIRGQITPAVTGHERKTLISVAA